VQGLVNPDGMGRRLCATVGGGDWCGVGLGVREAAIRRRLEACLQRCMAQRCMAQRWPFTLFTVHLARVTGDEWALGPN